MAKKSSDVSVSFCRYGMPACSVCHSMIATFQSRSVRTCIQLMSLLRPLRKHLQDDEQVLSCKLNYHTFPSPSLCSIKILLHFWSTTCSSQTFSYIEYTNCLYKAKQWQGSNRIKSIASFITRELEDLYRNSLRFCSTIGPCLTFAYN